MRRCTPHDHILTGQSPTGHYPVKSGRNYFKKTCLHKHIQRLTNGITHPDKQALGEQLAPTLIRKSTSCCILLRKIPPTGSGYHDYCRQSSITTLQGTPSASCETNIFIVFLFSKEIFPSWLAMEFWLWGQDGCTARALQLHKQAHPSSSPSLLACYLSGFSSASEPSFSLPRHQP